MCVLNQSKKKKKPPSITKEKNNTQIKTNKKTNPTQAQNSAKKTRNILESND